MLVAVGCAAGLLLGQAADPSDLQAAQALGDLSVSRLDWTDERSASLTITTGAQGAIVAPRGGVLTRSDCRPGQPLKTGTSPFAVDGHRLLALATRTPLWRDLPRGTKGRDSAALNRALRSLGRSAPGSSITSRTLHAYNSVAAHAGAERVTNAIPRAGVAWLAKPTVRPETCPTAVGSTIQTGAVLAGLPGPVVSARLTALPVDLAPGQRVLAVEGARLAIDARTGQLGAAGVEWIQAHPAAVRRDGEAQSVTGTLSLVNAVSVIPVPASALGPADGNHSCLTTPAEVVPVTVIGSQLGSVLVVPDEAASITLVAVDPSRVKPCR